MKDKKELLEQTIKEDLEKEAQEILKALETSDVDELSDEKQIELKKKIDKKIEDYEFEKICNGLPEEYQALSMEKARQMGKKQVKIRKGYGKRKVCVCMWR